MSPATRPRDLPPTLGMTLVEGGAEFAVYAGHAHSVEVCLYDADDLDGSTERRLPLTERTHGISTGPPLCSTTTMCGFAAATACTSWSWSSVE